MPNKESPLHSMEEGEVLQFDAGINYRYDVLKVPGGWLYTLIKKIGDEPVGLAYVQKPFFPQQ